MKIPSRKRDHRADRGIKNGPARTTRGRHLSPVITKQTIRAELTAHPVRRRQLLIELDRLYRLPLRQPILFHPATSTLQMAHELRIRLEQELGRTPHTHGVPRS